MFERFTDRARRVVVLAQEEARMCNHNYIGTEHLVLGMVHEGEGIAGKVLAQFDIDVDFVRKQVETIIGLGQQSPSGHIPFTPRAKKVLELSLREALQLGHNYIGTEHVLLGLLREGQGVGAQILFSAPAVVTATLDETIGDNTVSGMSVVRRAVLKMLGQPDRAEEKTNLGHGPDVTAALLDVKVPADLSLNEELRLLQGMEDFHTELRIHIENRGEIIREAELAWLRENSALGRAEAKEHEIAQELVDLHAKAVNLASIAGKMLAEASLLREHIERLLPVPPSEAGEVEEPDETG